jgi:2-dehydropantoate 2-reductase
MPAYSLPVEAREVEPVVIAGAGALGSVYGGVLAAAGVDVVLLAYGRHEEALREGELEVRLPDRTRRVRVRAADGAAGKALILTSRLFDTEAALDRVDGAPVLAISLQNGLRKNESLVRRFGAESVAPAVSMLAAEMLTPGVVESVGLGKTLVESGHPSAEELVRLLDGAGIPAELVDDGSSAEWSKLAQVAAMMGVQAVTRRFLHELMLSEDGALLFARILAEVAALAEAEGASVGDWPGMFPVQTLVDGGPEDAVALLRLQGEQLLAQGATTRRTSMLRAADDGRRTELDGIHGELLRHGEALGVPLPTVEACLRLARLSGVAD